MDAHGGACHPAQALTHRAAKAGICRHIPGAKLPQLSFRTSLLDALTITEEDGAVVALDWGWARDQAETPLLLRAREQLEEYLDGARTRFDLPLAPAGTPYRRRVWAALCDIPHGATRTYKDIALVAGGSSRSVGRRERRQPHPHPDPLPPRRGHERDRRLFRRRGPGNQTTASAARDSAAAHAPTEDSSMAKAIRIHAQGGPEVMRWEDVPTPEPGPAEALVHHTAVGLNYIDVYFRNGLYKVPRCPATLGMEAAGVVQRGRRGRPDRLRRRPRGLCHRPDRRLRHRPRHLRRPPGQGAGRGGRPDRRRHDAAGHDRPVPAPPHPPREGRRDHRRPRRRRRRRADPVPMGPATWAPP